jgi:adenylate kinase
VKGFVLMLGMVGAGKSVQSRLLGERHGWTWLSTGELLRASSDARLQQVLLSGQLLDDQVIFSLMETTIKAADTSLVTILDGFPRRLSQASWLEAYAGQYNTPILAALHLTVSPEVAAKRLAERDRSDDTEEGITLRNREYDEQIKPVVTQYRQAGLLHEIDADQGIQAVAADIDAALTRVAVL